VAWIKLVKAWRGTLRWDDVQKISPSELRYSGNRLTAILRVTKTTGPTKRVQELPLCISEFPYIPSPFWLKIGFDLLREGADFRRDAKEAGGRKTLLSPDFFFSDAGLPSRQCRQDKPTQAKGSLRCQMTLSESGWCLAEVVEIHLTNYVKLRSFLGSRHLCHNVSLFSFGK